MEANGTNNSIFETPEEDLFDPYEYEIGTAETIYKFVTDYLVFTLRLMVCVPDLAGSVLFIYAVYKFKRLQTRTNFILLNYFACFSCHSVSMTVLAASESIPKHVYHTLYLVIFGSLDASILFVLLLGIDWFLLANCERIFSKYKILYHWIIATIYLLTLILFIYFQVAFKITHGFILISFAIYFISCISLAVLNIIKRRRTYSQDVLKSSYILTICNAFFLLFLPSFVVTTCGIIIVHLRELPYAIVIILVCITYALGLIALSSPIVTIILLVKLDKNFRLSYHNLVKALLQRCVGSNNDIADNNYLDVDES